MSLTCQADELAMGDEAHVRRKRRINAVPSELREASGAKAQPSGALAHPPEEVAPEDGHDLAPVGRAEDGALARGVAQQGRLPKALPCADHWS